MQTKLNFSLGAKNTSLAGKSWGPISNWPKLPYKIETDRLGRILMSPPPFFDHVRNVIGRRAFSIFVRCSVNSRSGRSGQQCRGLNDLHFAQTDIHELVEIARSSIESFSRL
jgi:hypothetical protein